MKKILQSVLILILISSVVIFYQVFFIQEKDVVVILDKDIKPTENNVVKNLKYEIKVQENNNYQISSELSEIVYQNSLELVLMEGVSAKLKDNKNKTLFINSDKAIYNSNNFNTTFEKNIKISYLNNKISADKMVLNFQDNLISIFDNIRFIGPEVALEADNIVIDLITKKMNISMNNANEDILVSSLN